MDYPCANAEATENLVELADAGAPVLRGRLLALETWQDLHLALKPSPEASSTHSTNLLDYVHCAFLESTSALMTPAYLQNVEDLNFDLKRKQDLNYLEEETGQPTVQKVPRHSRLRWHALRSIQSPSLR